MKGIPYNDENGNIREDVIAEEIDSIKYEIKSNLEDAQDKFETFSKKLGIDPNQELKTNDNKNISDDDYNDYTYYKNEYDKEKKYFNKGEDKYRKLAIQSINKKLTQKNLINNPVNLEYYIEFKDGQVVSNISGESKSEIIDETKKKSKDYMMFLDIANDSPKQTYNTHNMEYKLDHLIYEDLEGKLKNVIIRIPNSLKEGDELYTVAQKNNISNIIGYGALLLLVLDIFILSILVFRLAKEKNIKFENTPVLKLYNKLPIEIKVLASILMLNTLLGLYNIITHWGAIL